MGTKCHPLFSLQMYMTIFQSHQLPAPMSMLEATAKANNLSALSTAFDKYTKDMDAVRCGLVAHASVIVLVMPPFRLLVTVWPYESRHSWGEK